MASKYLADESPLLVYPSLATAIGLNEAIVLQQIRYWTELNRKANKQDTHYHAGRWWTYGTYDHWQQTNFPFWSMSTVARTFRSLEKSGLIIGWKKNKRAGSHQKWYALAFDDHALDERLDAMYTERTGQQRNQVDITDHVNLAQSGTSNWHDQDRVNLAQSLTENTETTTENLADAIAPAPPASQPTAQPTPEPDTVKEKRPRKRKPPKYPAEVRTPMKNAIVAAFGWDASTITVWGDIETATNLLLDGGATPEDIHGLHKMCATRFENFGPVALAKYWPEYVKQRQAISAAPVPRPVDADADEKATFYARMYAGRYADDDARPTD